jgi:hypothetical protein
VLAPTPAPIAPLPEPTPAKDKPPQLVNLAIFDHRGITHGRQDVPMLADGKGDRPCCTASYTKEKKEKPGTDPAKPATGPTAAGILGVA